MAFVRQINQENTHKTTENIVSRSDEHSFEITYDCESIKQGSKPVRYSTINIITKSGDEYEFVKLCDANPV